MTNIIHKYYTYIFIIYSEIEVIHMAIVLHGIFTTVDLCIMWYSFSLG